MFLEDFMEEVASQVLWFSLTLFYLHLLGASPFPVLSLLTV